MQEARKELAPSLGERANAFGVFGDDLGGQVSTIAPVLDNSSVPKDTSRPRDVAPPMEFFLTPFVVVYNGSPKRRHQEPAQENRSYDPTIFHPVGDESAYLN